ncbi:MAG: hypothetical protein AAF560_29880, partial [Acidobacteriota bacterium]
QHHLPAERLLTFDQKGRVDTGAEPHAPVRRIDRDAAGEEPSREAAAEWGVPGVLAMVWFAGVVGYRLRRLAATEDATDLATMIAGLVALTLLAATNFPLRIALVGYPALFFMSWVFAVQRERIPADGVPADGVPTGRISPEGEE